MTKKLPPDLEKRLTPKPSQPHELTTCAVCGQAFDMKDLVQAHHHSADPHAPLPPR